MSFLVRGNRLKLSLLSYLLIAFGLLSACGESAKSPVEKPSSASEESNTDPMHIKRQYQAPAIDKYKLNEHIDLSVPLSKRDGEQGKRRRDLLLHDNVYQLPETMVPSVKSGAETVTFSRDGKNAEALLDREPGDIVISMENEQFAWRKIKDITVTGDEIQWETTTPPMQEVIKKGRFRAELRVNPSTMPQMPENIELALPYLRPQGPPATMNALSGNGSIQTRKQKQNALETGDVQQCAPCQKERTGKEGCWVADMNEAPLSGGGGPTFAQAEAFCNSLDHVYCDQYKDNTKWRGDKKQECKGYADSWKAVWNKRLDPASKYDFDDDGSSSDDEMGCVVETKSYPSPINKGPRTGAVVNNTGDNEMDFCQDQGEMKEAIQMTNQFDGKCDPIPFPAEESDFKTLADQTWFEWIANNKSDKVSLSTGTWPTSEKTSAQLTADYECEPFKADTSVGGQGDWRCYKEANPSSTDGHHTCTRFRGFTVTEEECSASDPCSEGRCDLDKELCVKRSGGIGAAGFNDSTTYEGVEEIDGYEVKRVQNAATLEDKPDQDNDGIEETDLHCVREFDGKDISDMSQSDFPDGSGKAAKRYVGKPWKEGRGVCVTDTCRYDNITAMLTYFRKLDEDHPRHVAESVNDVQEDPHGTTDDDGDPVEDDDEGWGASGADPGDTPDQHDGKKIPYEDQRADAKNSFQRFSSLEIGAQSSIDVPNFQSCFYTKGRCIKSWEAFRYKQFGDELLNVKYGGTAAAGSKDYCDLQFKGDTTACEIDSQCDAWEGPNVDVDCVGDNVRDDNDDGDPSDPDDEDIRSGTCVYSNVTAPETSTLDYGVANAGEESCKEQCIRGVQKYEVGSDGDLTPDGKRTASNNGCEINCNCAQSCRSNLTKKLTSLEINDSGSCDPKNSTACSQGQTCDGSLKPGSNKGKCVPSDTCNPTNGPNGNAGCSFGMTCNDSVRPDKTDDDGNVVEKRGKCVCDTQKSSTCGKSGYYCNGKLVGLQNKGVCVKNKGKELPVKVVKVESTGVSCSESNPCSDGSCDFDKGECVKPRIRDKVSYEYFYERANRLTSVDFEQSNTKTFPSKRIRLKQWASQAINVCESQARSCSNKCTTCRSLNCTEECGQSKGSETCQECLYKTGCKSTCDDLNAEIQTCKEPRYCQNSYHVCSSPGFCATRDYGATGNPCDKHTDDNPDDGTGVDPPVDCPDGETCGCEAGEVCAGDIDPSEDNSEIDPDDGNPDGQCQLPTTASAQGGIGQGNPNLLEKILSIAFSLMMGKSPLAIIKQLAMPHPKIPGMPQFRTDQVMNVNCEDSQGDVKEMVDNIPDGAWLNGCKCQSGQEKCKVNMPMGAVKRGGQKLRDAFPTGAVMDKAEDVAGKLLDSTGIAKTFENSPVGDKIQSLQKKLPSGVGNLFGGSAIPIKRTIVGAGFDFTFVLDAGFKFLPPGLNLKLGVRSDFFFGLIFEFNFRKTKDWKETVRAGPFMLIPFTILGYPLPIMLELHAGAEFHAYIESSIAVGAAYFTVPEKLDPDGPPEEDSTEATGSLNQGVLERSGSSPPDTLPSGARVPKLARAGAWPSSNFTQNWFSGAKLDEVKDWREDNLKPKKNQLDHWGVDLILEVTSIGYVPTGPPDFTTEFNSSFARMVRSKTDLEADFQAEAGLQVGLYDGTSQSRLIFFEPANLFFRAYAAITAPYCGAGFGLFYRVFIGFGPLKIFSFTLAEGFRLPLLIREIFGRDWLFPPTSWRSQGPGQPGKCDLENPGAVNDDLDALSQEFKRNLNPAESFFCRLAHTLGCVQPKKPETPELGSKPSKCGSDADCPDGDCVGQFCVDRKEDDARITLHWNADANLNMEVVTPDSTPTLKQSMGSACCPANGQTPPNCTGCPGGTVNNKQCKCPNDKTCVRDKCPTQLNRGEVVQNDICHAGGCTNPAGGCGPDKDSVVECVPPYGKNTHAENITIPGKHLADGPYTIKVRFPPDGVGYDMGADCRDLEPSETVPETCKVKYTVNIEYDGRVQTFSGKIGPSVGMTSPPLRYEWRAQQGADTGGDVEVSEPISDVLEGISEDDDNVRIFTEKMNQGNPKKDAAQTWCDNNFTGPHSCAEVTCTDGTKKRVGSISGWTAVPDNPGQGYRCEVQKSNVDITTDINNNLCREIGEGPTPNGDLGGKELDLTNECINTANSSNVPTAVTATVDQPQTDITVDDNYRTGDVGNPSQTTVTVSGGKDTTSYYFHYDPVTNGTVMCGSVTFENQIVGIAHKDATVGPSTKDLLSCQDVPEDTSYNSRDDGYLCQNEGTQTWYHSADGGYGAYAFDGQPYGNPALPGGWPEDSADCGAAGGDFYRVTNGDRTLEFEVHTFGNTDSMRIITEGPKNN